MHRGEPYQLLNVCTVTCMNSEQHGAEYSPHPSAELECMEIHFRTLSSGACVLEQLCCYFCSFTFYTIIELNAASF
jgi:hypothetical protein